MKILLSFLQDSNLSSPHNIPAYRFWSYYIKNGIEEAGMQWFEIPGLDWAAGLIPLENTPELIEWKERSWEKTLNYVKTNKQNIDVFLTYLYPKQIEITAIEEIRKLGIPCINFYCDHIRQYTKLPDEFKVFDLMWVPEFEAISLYEKAKIDFINLPMPMWVSPKYRSVTLTQNTNISFIGSKDQLREKLLSRAIGNGFLIEIRGDGWERSEEKLPSLTKGKIFNKIHNQIKFIETSGFKHWIIKNLQGLGKKPNTIPEQYLLEKPNFEDYIKITQQSLITLGINRVPSFQRLNNNPLIYSRLRDIEAPMLGACYITEYNEGLTKLYEIGQEIETYKTVDELIFKCTELRNSPALRNELRIGGQKRALESHTIPHSLEKIKKRLFN